MKRRRSFLAGLLTALLLASAGLYVAGRFGVIGEGFMMLARLPLMLGIVCLCCILYAEETSDEKRDR